jgi:hypothetical protein
LKLFLRRDVRGCRRDAVRAGNTHKVHAQRETRCFRGKTLLQGDDEGGSPAAAVEGIEALHMLRKGQVKRLGARDSAGQMKFVASLFGVAA